MMTAEAVYKQVKGEHMLVSFRWEQRQQGTNWVLMNTCQTAGNTSATGATQRRFVCWKYKVTYSTYCYVESRSRA